MEEHGLNCTGRNCSGKFMESKVAEGPNYDGGQTFLFLALLLLLAGDVESNPGPDNHSQESNVVESLPIKIDLEKVSHGQGLGEDISDIKETLNLLRDGQALILVNQKAMLSRIGVMETELEVVKSKIGDLGCKQFMMENILDKVEGKILERQSDAKDLHYEVCCLEQYSRKNFV